MSPGMPHSSATDHPLFATVAASIEATFGEAIDDLDFADLVDAALAAHDAR